jgi:hypothetical protein
MAQNQASGIRNQESGIRFQVSGFRFQVSGFRLQASGFRLQASGFRLQLSLTERLGYLDSQSSKETTSLANETGRVLNGLLRSLKPDS